MRRSALPTADLAIRKLAAIAALARYGAAKPQMLDSIPIEPELWPTSAVIDWLGVLKRVQGIAAAGARREAALQILRTRLNFQGTTMAFSTERNDALWWLMISGDSNAESHAAVDARRAAVARRRAATRARRARAAAARTLEHHGRQCAGACWRWRNSRRRSSRRPSPARRASATERSSRRSRGRSSANNSQVELAVAGRECVARASATQARASPG